jgi:hypothetical protein
VHIGRLFVRRSDVHKLGMPCTLIGIIVHHLKTYVRNNAGQEVNEIVKMIT